MSCRWGMTALLFAATLPLDAADGDRTVVKLHLNLNVPAWSGWSVDFGEPKDAAVIAEAGTTREGKVGGVAVSATRRQDGEGYLLHLKSRDGEASAVVTAAASARVEIPEFAGTLPYRITLNPNAGPGGAPREELLYTPEYRAEGTLTAGECKARMAIWDLNADGIFDRRDFLDGTTAGIDLNGDGKISGKGEFVHGGEVFEFCGRRFYVDPDSLGPDGLTVTVVETALDRPMVGSPVPIFTVESTNGAALRSSEWKGKTVLLDFWASWCGFCIEGFPKIKEMHDSLSPNLQVISINTDEPSALDAARRVAEAHEMPWTQVMSGKGLNDPAWMMFRALDGGMPLYVLIDREGVIRYSGSGGENLSDLRSAVNKYTAKQ